MGTCGRIVQLAQGAKSETSLTQSAQSDWYSTPITWFTYCTAMSCTKAALCLHRMVKDRVMVITLVLDCCGYELHNISHRGV